MVLPLDIKQINIKDMPYIIPNTKILKILSKKLNEEITRYINENQDLDIIENILKLCEDNKIRFDDIEEYIMETDIIKNLKEQNTNQSSIANIGLF